MFRIWSQKIHPLTPVEQMDDHESEPEVCKGGSAENPPVIENLANPPPSPAKPDPPSRRALLGKKILGNLLENFVFQVKFGGFFVIFGEISFNLTGFRLI